MAASSVGSGNSVDLDPIFVKALVLLHSKNPDSLDQLRALRDEAIRQHNQPVPLSSKVFQKLRKKHKNVLCKFILIFVHDISY